MKANSDIQANARAYALEALKDQLQAVEQAYIQGYKDAMAMIPREPIKDGDDEFVDMGLESGTMWTSSLSTKKPRILSYGFYNALQHGIPTQEQLEELFARSKYVHPGYATPPTIIGPSSFGISLIRYGVKIWVNSDVIDDEALACEIGENGSHRYVRNFVGEKLFILRVKNKNEE